MTPESLQVLRDFSETKMAPSLPMLRKAVKEALSHIYDLELEINLVLDEVDERIDL